MPSLVFPQPILGPPKVFRIPVPFQLAVGSMNYNNALLTFDPKTTAFNGSLINEQGLPSSVGAFTFGSICGLDEPTVILSPADTGVPLFVTGTLPRGRQSWVLSINCPPIVGQPVVANPLVTSGGTNAFTGGCNNGLACYQSLLYVLDASGALLCYNALTGQPAALSGFPNDATLFPVGSFWGAYGLACSNSGALAVVGTNNNYIYFYQLPQASLIGFLDLPTLSSVLHLSGIQTMAFDPNGDFYLLTQKGGILKFLSTTGRYAGPNPTTPVLLGQNGGGHSNPPLLSPFGGFAVGGTAQKPMIYAASAAFSPQGGEDIVDTYIYLYDGHSGEFLGTFTAPGTNGGATQSPAMAFVYTFNPEATTM